MTGSWIHLQIGLRSRYAGKNSNVCAAETAAESSRGWFGATCDRRGHDGSCRVHEHEDTDRPADAVLAERFRICRLDRSERRSSVSGERWRGERLGILLIGRELWTASLLDERVRERLGTRADPGGRSRDNQRHSREDEPIRRASNLQCAPVRERVMTLTFRLAARGTTIETDSRVMSRLP